MDSLGFIVYSCRLRVRPVLRRGLLKFKGLGNLKDSKEIRYTGDLRQKGPENDPAIGFTPLHFQEET
jgi:hypothetical protein